MAYYAQKPARQREQSAGSYNRPGIDPDGFCTSIGCEALSLLACCSFVSPCWIAVLLPATILLGASVIW